MIVLDASVVVELLLGGERAEPVLGWFDSNEGELHAPGLVDVEVAQALRRLVLSGKMRAARGNAAIEILEELPISRHPANPLLHRIWQLRGNLSAYDATYVALAEAMGCRLLTADRGLARAAGSEAGVELLRP